MYLFIASVALLGVLAAARAQDQRFSALAALAGGPRSDPDRSKDAPPADHETIASRDGCSGAVGAL